MCDTLCALGAAGVDGSWFAKNSDRPPDEAQPMRALAPRREHRTRATYLEVDGAPGDTLAVVGAGPRWMWGLEHGLNQAGVAIGNERVWTDVDPADHPDALTGMDLVRLGLERGASASEALAVLIALLEQHGQGGAGHEDGTNPYWSSFLVADRDQAFVLETSARDWAVEEVPSGSARAISNRLTIPDFEAQHRFADPGGVLARLVHPRWDASNAVLAEGPLGLERAKQHLRSHVGGPDGHTICMHDPAVATTASMVARLDGERSQGWFLLGSPCRSVYVPLWPGLALGDVPAWERFAALGDDTAASLRALEARLDVDARPDETWGPEAWRRVADALDASS